MILLIALLLIASPVFADGLSPIGSDGIARGTYGDPGATMHFYVDADAGTSSAFAGTAPLVSGAFAFPIPDRFKDGKPHTIYAYWVTTSSGLLAGSPQFFTLAPAQTYPPITYTLDWKAGVVDKTHPAPTGYRVFNDGKQIADVPSTVLTYSQTLSLPPSADPCWTVQAYVPGGNAPQSNKVCASMIVDVPPPTYPSVPPLTSLSQQVAPIVWTLGAPSKQYPGNYDILRNGSTVQGARGSQIAMCGNVIYVLGRDKLWWRFNVNSWIATGQATLTCAAP